MSVNHLDLLAESHILSSMEKEQILDNILSAYSNQFYDGAKDTIFFDVSKRPYEMRYQEDIVSSLYTRLMSTLDGSQGVMLAKLESVQTHLQCHWAAMGFKAGFDCAVVLAEEGVPIHEPKKGYFGCTELEEEDCDIIEDMD